MFRNIKFLISVLLFWIVFSLFNKVLFIIFEWNITSAIGYAEILKAFIFGIKLDISLACYLGMFVSILSLLLLINDSYFRRTTAILHYILIPIFSFIVIADLEIYKNWLSHIDVSVFQFFDKTFSVLSSTDNSVLIILISVWLIISSSFIYVYYKVINKQLLKPTINRWFYPFIIIFIGSTLYIPARGGVDVASMNTGSVYFSKKIEANHVAVNSVWNFLSSFTQMSVLGKSPQYMDSKKAHELYKIYSNQGVNISNYVVRTQNPNVIIIMMESFESDITKTLGGVDGYTPKFDSLIHEGVLFSNMFSAGTRTDKGLVAILSGYPAQSTKPIIGFSSKVEKLPTISKTLSQYGYNSLFVYGGNKQFSNMNSLITTGNFVRVIDVQNFDDSLRTFKWGVHDEFVLKKSIEEINNLKSPFFTYIMTLSNHEPYAVPKNIKFNGKGSEALFYSAAFYADSCFGSFIAEAKKQTWWNNTLIIVVADHASIRPGNKTPENLNRYRIPMLWLGGALKTKDTIVSKYCSQMDVATTLLDQLNKHDSSFIYSKNIFNKNNKGFALFSYHEGFGLITNSSCQIYDNLLKKYLVNTGTFTGNDSLFAKAFWQIASEDFQKK